MASDKEAQWRMAGDRIQTLLDSCAAGGTAAQERAQQLVREVVGLYGAGLERIMEAGDPGLAERLATDDLVASLLLVHGLHPHDVHRRVSDALDRVRPYLGSHGGDVDLLGITDGPDGARVLLAFKGSCKSCPSSAVTLELAVQDAVRAAAPEVSVDRGGAGRPRHQRRHPGRIPAGAPPFEWPRPLTHLASDGSRAGRAAARRGRRLRHRRHHGAGLPRRRPARSPIGIIARSVTTRWPVRRCETRDSQCPGCARVSTSCMPAPG